MNHLVVSPGHHFCVRKYATRKTMSACSKSRPSKVIHHECCRALLYILILSQCKVIVLHYVLLYVYVLYTVSGGQRSEVVKPFDPLKHCAWSRSKLGEISWTLRTRLRYKSIRPATLRPLSLFGKSYQLDN